MEIKSIKNRRIFFLVLLLLLILTDIISYFVFTSMVRQENEEYFASKYEVIQNFNGFVKSYSGRNMKALNFLNRERAGIERFAAVNGIDSYFISDSTLFPVIESESFKYDQKFLSLLLYPAIKDGMSMRYFIDGQDIYSFSIPSGNGERIYAVFAFKMERTHINGYLVVFFIYKAILLMFIITVGLSLINAIEEPINNITSVARNLGFALNRDSSDDIVKLFRNSVEEIIRQRDDRRLAAEKLDIELGKVKREMLERENLHNLAEISGGIAHQLNNNLASIIGLIQIGIKKNDMDMVKNGLGEIKKLEEFTAKFLSFSKDVSPFKRKVNLEEFIRGVFIRTGLDADYDFPESPIIVMTDPVLLEQVIINIIDNVRKYSSGKRVNVKAADFTAKAMLEITDSGPGFPPEVIQKKVVPFWEKASGAGLGIPTIMKIANMLNHSVSFSNRGERGCVTLEFYDYEEKSADS